jgi:DNA-binding transcriptional ArsR family regulator
MKHSHAEHGNDQLLANTFRYWHIGKFRYLRGMDLLEIFKALSNRTRLEILKGLKDPEKHFPPQDEGDVHTVGVCVSSIQEGVGLSQSTVSDYLATLQRAGLVEVRRIGQWTYYKRNEAAISALAEIIGSEL